MSSRSSRTLPVKVLVALSATVLLAHLAVLQGVPMHLGPTKETMPLSQTFTTRTVTLVPVKPTSLERPVTASRKSTAPSPTKAASPKPAGIPTSRASAAAPPPPDVIAQTETPSPAEPNANPTTPTPDERPSEADELVSRARPPFDRASAVMAYTIPGSVRFKYKVEANKFPFSASAELLWQHDGENYDIRLELSAFGQTRVQTSRGQITAQGLAPLRFSDKFRSEVAAHFDREKGKVTFSANTPDVPLLAGAQDRLSILVQLGAMIAGDPGHYAPATTIAVQTIGPRDADTWLFTVGAEETLTLPGGEYATLKLLRNPRQEFDQKVELWLAPALRYLPVRIRITEPNGDFIDQKWLATEPQI